jgi:hypothetical protein
MLQVVEVHMVCRMAVHGNAKFYNCFVDEGLNGTLKEIARRAHPLTFSMTVFRRVLLGVELVNQDR